MTIQKPDIRTLFRTLLTCGSEDRLSMYSISLRGCRFVWLSLTLLLFPAGLLAQEESALDDARPGHAAQLPEAPDPVDDTAPTVFPHPENTRYLITGQTNIIFQAKG